MLRYIYGHCLPVAFYHYISKNGIVKLIYVYLTMGIGNEAICRNLISFPAFLQGRLWSNVKNLPLPMNAYRGTYVWAILQRTSGQIGG